MAEMIKLTISKGIDSELMLGGLRFEACRREIEKIDGGITLRIFLGDEAEAAELLRFDCFRGSPHYHAPGENRAETKIDSERFGDGKAFVIEQLSANIPALMEQAGFSEDTSRLDLPTLAGVEGPLMALFDSLAEPTETSHFEVAAADLGPLAAQFDAAG